VLLSIEGKQIAPDITVLEMTGRIILANNSRDVEWKLAELLADQAKKIIFDLSRIINIAQHRYWNFGRQPGKDQPSWCEIANCRRHRIRGKHFENQQR
jgi:hypothetical protein